MLAGSRGATSEETASLARQEGIPLLTLAEAEILDLTVDGADEVDPQLDLIKGYGRDLVREKIVAASSRRLVILVGDEKIVPQLGTRGKLPVEVVPFAVPLCERRLGELGCRPVLTFDDGRTVCDGQRQSHSRLRNRPIPDAVRLEMDIRAIPGVVGTGLFLGMADTVLVGDRNDFRIIEERHRRHNQLSKVTVVQHGRCQGVRRRRAGQTDLPLGQTNFLRTMFTRKR